MLPSGIEFLDVRLNQLQSSRIQPKAFMVSQMSVHHTTLFLPMYPPPTSQSFLLKSGLEPKSQFPLFFFHLWPIKHASREKGVSHRAILVASALSANGKLSALRPQDPVSRDTTPEANTDSLPFLCEDTAPRLAFLYASVPLTLFGPAPQTVSAILPLKIPVCL